jgi:hypothetical protein
MFIHEFSQVVEKAPEVKPPEESFFTAYSYGLMINAARKHSEKG